MAKVSSQISRGSGSSWRSNHSLFTNPLPTHPIKDGRNTIVNRHSLRLRALSAFVAMLCALLALAGCKSSSTTASDFARAKEVAKTCPASGKVAGLINLDVSGSGRLPDVGSERLSIIENITRRTVVCGGHLRVTVFSATSANTVSLHDGEVSLPGATENARLRRSEKAVQDAVQQVAANYPAAIRKVSPAHSDITAEFRLASEYKQQLGADYHLDFTVLTDGLQTLGPRITKPIAVADARKVASAVKVPSLEGASVTIAGVGKVATGGVPSSALTNSLVAYWNEVCRKTKAARCSVVTDYTQAGR